MGCRSDPKPEDEEYLTKDVLRLWLLASVNRGQSYFPLSYFIFVQDIFNLGVIPSSVFGRCLTEAAAALSQRFRGLQHVLAESKKISQVQDKLQASSAVQKYSCPNDTRANLERNQRRKA